MASALTASLDLSILAESCVQVLVESVQLALHIRHEISLLREGVVLHRLRVRFRFGFHLVKLLGVELSSDGLHPTAKAVTATKVMANNVFFIMASFVLGLCFVLTLAHWPYEPGCNPTGNPCGICQAWGEDPIAPVQAPGVIWFMPIKHLSQIEKPTGTQPSTPSASSQQTASPVPRPKGAVASRGSSIEPDHGALPAFP